VPSLTRRTKWILHIDSSATGSDIVLRWDAGSCLQARNHSAFTILFETVTVNMGSQAEYKYKNRTEEFKSCTVNKCEVDMKKSRLSNYGCYRMD